MKPRLVVYIPPAMQPVDVPEFEVEWRSHKIDVRLFLNDTGGQCRADEVVRRLAGGGPPSVYVLDCDGYYPGLNFVFGLAIPALRTAVVFTERLRGVKFGERLAKEITHEGGHLYGLGHCRDPTCVMYFSNTIHDTDRKRVTFCHRCKSLLQKVK